MKNQRSVARNNINLKKKPIVNNMFHHYDVIHFYLTFSYHPINIISTKAIVSLFNLVNCCVFCIIYEFSSNINKFIYFSAVMSTVDLTLLLKV